MKRNSESKWEGKVSTKLTRATADQIWPLFTDFFNLQKWFPGLFICYGIHGTNGEPGCIRYCSGFSVSSKGGGGDEAVQPTRWSKERLIAVDNGGRSLSYEIVDSNIGFKSYVSTVKIVPGDQNGCVIEWWFTVEPVEGWTFDDLIRKYEMSLQGMAKVMEETVLFFSNSV